MIRAQKLLSFICLTRAAAVVALVTLGSVSTLQARHGDDDDDRQEFERRIRLARTEAAPAKASGTAELEVGHRSASRSNRIEVETRGLLPGEYTVTVFDRFGGTSALLGTFVVGDDDDDSDDGNDRNRGRGRGHGKGGDDDDGEGKFEIPDAISALDLGLLSVTDGSGAEVLTGNFASAANTVNGRVRWRVGTTGGVGAADAIGRAEIKGNVNRRGNGTFRLDAENLPANT